MTESLDIWSRSVSDFLRAYMGEDFESASQAEWAAFVARRDPLVTIFGPYDSGKTSLLKRILVENGEPVPKWATVSARRETYETNEAEAVGCAFRDTPGLEGGNPVHEQQTIDSLALSHAYILVLLPQLVTSGADMIWRLLKGELFAKELTDPLMPGSALIVVGRMDEAGIDPADGEEEFKELVNRKRSELAEMFREREIETDGVEVHFVSADPYGVATDLTDPSLDDYQTGRSWDGMTALLESLSPLTKRKQGLEAFAKRRYLALLCVGARTALEDRLTLISTDLEECNNWKKRLDLFEQRSKALRDAAKASLESAVEEELMAISRLGISEAQEAEAVIQDKISAVLDDWDEEHSAKFSALVKEIEDEIAASLDRPGARHLEKRFIRIGSVGEEDKGGVDLAIFKNRGQLLYESLRKSMEAYQEAQLGMTLEAARKELGRVAQFQEIDSYLAQARTERGFRSATHVARADKYLRLADLVRTIGPLVVELGGWLLDAYLDQQQRNQRADERLRLQREIREAADKICSGVFRGWSETVQALHRELESKRRFYEENAEVIREELSRLNAGLSQVEKLIATIPAVDGGS